jgi:ubiquinone/menaquinone biosynthesis C-methylase UbiE
MDATVHRPAKTESGESVNQADVGVHTDEIALANCDVVPSVAPGYLSAMEGYDRWAPTYDEGPNPLLNLEERMVAPLLPNLSGKHVLDLACGTGRWLERIAAQGAHPAVGVDLSSAMLGVADRKPSIAGCLAQANCQLLPFRSSTFDFVECSFALGHFQDLAAMVCELARVTKFGSEVFVSDLHPEAYARGWRTGFRDLREAVQIDAVPRTIVEIIRAFHSGGFESLAQASWYLGEPERILFARADKSQVFEHACQVPAVLFCRFRLGTPTSGSRNENAVL